MTKKVCDDCASDVDPTKLATVTIQTEGGYRTRTRELCPQCLEKRNLPADLLPLDVSKLGR